MELRHSPGNLTGEEKWMFNIIFKMSSLKEIYFLSPTFLMESLIYIRRQPNYRFRQTKAANCDFNAMQSFRERSEE